MIVDLNCDLGEGAIFDAELLPLITSANLSCGGHAGDKAIVRETLRLARENGVVVGAHPGYADREHFGRREMTLAANALRELILGQIATLLRWAESVSVVVCYMKPHGALYNQACRDEQVAGPVVEVAERCGLPVLALPGSALESQCHGRVPFFREGFADRHYRPDGSLVPRSEADAMLTDIDDAVRQGKRLIEGGVHSLCVHGDNPHALAFVRELRRALLADGVTLAPFASSPGTAVPGLTPRAPDVSP